MGRLHSESDESRRRRAVWEAVALVMLTGKATTIVSPSAQAAERTMAEVMKMVTVLMPVAAEGVHGMIPRACPTFPHCEHDTVHGCDMPATPNGTRGGHFVVQCPRPRCLPLGTIDPVLKHRVREGRR